MEYIPAQKKRHLDFTRPTFNEPLMPELNEEISVRDSVKPSLLGSLADDEESINESNSSDGSKVKQIESINVYLRLRPPKLTCSMYKFTKDTVIIPQVSNLNQGTKNTEKHYKFTSILKDTSNQKEIYDEIVRPVLSKPFEIRGSTFASYGVSNSGKTYTILGDTSAGIIPRAITQLFTENQSIIAPFPYVKFVNDQISLLDDANVEYEMDALDEFLNKSAKLSKGKVKKWSHDDINNEHSFTVLDDENNKINKLYIWISFVEIYNEKITDLLNNQTTKAPSLTVYSNNKNSFIHGSTWLFAPNIDTAFNILNYGLNRIKYASTGINDHSSRSHTILIINMIAETGTDFQFSSFKFCDLAGAERVRKTKNVGDRLKEAGGINNSLLVLGRCLEAVQSNQTKTNKKSPDSIIPVRDSKLTLLLQSSLYGHEKFVMIVNLYPTADFFDENLNILKFGSIANQIVNKKSEPRVFARFSYLSQNPAFNNSIMNGSAMNETISEISEHEYESELDDSFKWSGMNKEQLIRELRTQNAFTEELTKKILQSEKDHNDDRRKILQTQQEIQSRIARRNEEELKIQMEYHEKKMKNLEIKYERKLMEAYDEINFLRRKLNKLKPEEFSSDDTEDEEDDYDEEDVIEVDE